MREMTADRRRMAGLVVLGVLVVLIATSPAFFLTSGYRLDVARLALYMAILASTWSLLAGVAGQFSFAHVALAGLGGYAGAIWVRDVSGWPGSVYGGIVIGTLFAWLVGTLLGLLLLRLRAAYLALFTIAFAELARLTVVAETDFTGGRLSLAVQQLPGDETAHFYLVLVLLGAILGWVYWLLRSRTGLFLRAMREDEQAAAALGVNVVRAKVFVFSITSLMIGLAASVYTHTVSRIAPERLELLVMGQVIAVAVIGGLESPLAAAIGALVVFGTLENLREISIGPGAMNVVTVLLAVGILVLVYVIFRAFRSAGAPVPRRIGRLAPWLVISVALITVFLFMAGGEDGDWTAWMVLIAGAVALSVFVMRSYAAGLPAWLERVYPAVLVASVALSFLIRSIPGESLDVELGVWRFGVFGAILMITLRFARNGLIFPILQYFSGAKEARKETVEFRDAGDDASHAPQATADGRPDGEVAR